MKPQTGTAEKKTNKPSALLSPDENEQVFAMLGRRCQVSAPDHNIVSAEDFAGLITFLIVSHANADHVYSCGKTVHHRRPIALRLAQTTNGRPVLRPGQRQAIVLHSTVLSR